MFFSKSMTIDSDNAGSVALAADSDSVRSNAEIRFIERLKAGDAAAFDTLVMRYSGDLYSLLMRLMENAEEAADLTQETFMSALKAIDKFRGDSDIKTWLFRIAINKSRNRHRWWKRRKRDETISMDASYGSSDTPLSETFESGINNPEQETLRRERQKILIDALNELPEIFREAVVLCDIEGFSYEEIAETLDINPGTVKSRISRGREELRKNLKDI